MHNESEQPKLVIPALGGLYRVGSELAYPLIRFVRKRGQVVEQVLP